MERNFKFIDFLSEPNKFHEFKKFLKDENYISAVIEFNSTYFPEYPKNYINDVSSLSFDDNVKSCPESLFKFYDADGGCKALENMTLKFSNALSFMIPGYVLSDITELNHSRFYIDTITIEEFRRQYQSLEGRSLEDVLASILHHHYSHTYYKNLICCFSTTLNNEYLWNNNNHQICIEYNTNLFFNRHLDIEETSQFFYNKIHYVDKLYKFPYRLSDNTFLKNTLFVKCKYPHVNENEFRIVLNKSNIQADSDNNISTIEIFKNGIKDTMKINSDFIRFDQEYIRMVYLKKGKKDLTEILDVLRINQIPFKYI